MRKKAAVLTLFLMILICFAFSAYAESPIDPTETICLPDSLLRIEAGAFESTESISCVIVPETVLRIDSRAFAYSSLKKIELPESLEFIADDAFEGCEGWKACVHPGSYAQAWCDANNVSYDLYELLTALDTPAIADIIMQDEYTTAMITWNPVDNAQGYRLYCAYPWEPEYFEWIRTITQANAVLDTDLEPDETYIYKLQAFAYNANGELILSELSEPFAVYTAETVDTPTIEEITTVGVTGLRLNWQAVRNAAVYEVYRSTTGETDSFVKIAETAELFYEDSGLPSGTSYWYCIQGRSESGVLSEMSNVCNAETDQVKYRALLIGNTYPGESEALPGPDNDLAAMTRMMRLQTATPYAVTSMLNVTTTQILAAIPQAFTGADNTDVSVFYYSGHGTQNGNLCGVQGTRMSSQQLRLCLDQIPGTKVVLLDCCYSGYHINKSADNTQTMEKAFNEAVISAFAAKERSYLAADEYIVLTACSKKQSSVSDVIFTNGRLFHFGAYTYALTQGSGFDLKTQQTNALLADEDGDANNLVSLGEAYNYIVKVIDSNPRYSQNAQYYGDLNFVLWGQNP